MFIRVDDRYIHGQVGVTWLSYSKCSEVLVMNDALAEDELACTMQKLSAPTYKVNVMNMKDGTDYIKGLPSQKADKLFVIVSSPFDARTMMEAGIPITVLNVGHSTPRTKEHIEVYNQFYVSPEEAEVYAWFQEKGVEIDFRLVPNHKAPKIDFKTYRK